MWLLTGVGWRALFERTWEAVHRQRSYFGSCSLKQTSTETASAYLLSPWHWRVPRGWEPSAAAHPAHPSGKAPGEVEQLPVTLVQCPCWCCWARLPCCMAKSTEEQCQLKGVEVHVCSSVVWYFGMPLTIKKISDSDDLLITWGFCTWCVKVWNLFIFFRPVKGWL